jgi:RNA polymerase-associated protein CTR9
MPTVESLARKAVEYTDVHAIASDGWYLLARKEHHSQELSRACEYYKKADEARGGVDKGYLPAKLGVAQVLALLGDMDGAKFRLEKIVQQYKTPEAMLLLGTLYAQEVAASQAANAKEDKSTERKRGITLLEGVRLAWKDPNKRLSPDVSVLLSLAQLYEKEAPEKSRQCLLLVEQMELDRLIKERVPDALSREPDVRAQMREQLSPHLLNSLGCYEYLAESYAAARDTFQTALSTCSSLARNGEAPEADALITTITYNLARSYEADGQLDKAKQTYEELLERHSDYTDASTRLAYIALRQSPNDEGPKAVAALMQKDPANLEARALYGWFLSKSKKRSTNIAEDPEQRHYKHTLQQFDKHDRYALTGMGNLYLAYAREMRRETEAEREKRRKMYEKAVELFDKALLLDPQNAYATQGIAIALVEEKKDYTAAVQLYAKLRDTLRESTVSINMGHVYSELKQYTRAIEHVGRPVSQKLRFSR